MTNLGDIVSAREIKQFLHKSYQDFPWDGSAKQECHLCSIIQSVIEFRGYRRTLAEHPQVPIIIVLSGHGSEWGFRLLFRQQELSLFSVQIVSPMGAFQSRHKASHLTKSQPSDIAKDLFESLVQQNWP
jgi:hypothetical protein